MSYMFMDHRSRFLKLLSFMQETTEGMRRPMVFLLQEDYGKDPFVILIGCLLSLRSRDVVTYPVCKKLFKLAMTPDNIHALPLKKLEEILYPIGSYRRKALLLHEISRELQARFQGLVPKTLDELLSLKGVGRKTANLVLSVAYDVPTVCVDTHVHRLSNQLGFVHTKSPEETEQALRSLVPRDRWVDINHLFVSYGQHIPRKRQISLARVALDNEENLKR